MQTPPAVSKRKQSTKALEPTGNQVCHDGLQGADLLPEGGALGHDLLLPLYPGPLNLEDGLC